MITIYELVRASVGALNGVQAFKVFFHEIVMLKETRRGLSFQISFFKYAQALGQFFHLFFLFL